MHRQPEQWGFWQAVHPQIELPNFPGEYIVTVAQLRRILRLQKDDTDVIIENKKQEPTLTQIAQVRFDRVYDSVVIEVDA